MKAFLSNTIKKKQFLLLLVDCFIVLCAFLSSYAFRIVVYEAESIALIGERIGWLVWGAVFLHVFALYIFDLYNLETRRSEAGKFVLIVLSVIIATTMLALLSYMDPKNKLGRVVLAAHLPLTIVMIYLWRRLFAAFFNEGVATNNLLLIGRGAFQLH